jgi:hypothetical protein
MYPDALSNKETLLKSIWCRVDAVLHQCRFLQLIETYMSCMLLASGLYGSPSLTYIYFPALVRNAAHARDFQTQVILDILSAYPFFFFGYMNHSDIVFS